MNAILIAAAISTFQPDPVMSATMEAAGGLTTLMAICPDIKLPRADIDRMLTLEAALRLNPAYVVFFDEGVAKMTAEALANPDVCRDQALNFETY